MINNRFLSLSAAILLASLLAAAGGTYFLHSEHARRQEQRNSAAREVQIHTHLLERHFERLASAPALLAGALRSGDGKTEFQVAAGTLTQLQAGVSALELAPASGHSLSYPPAPSQPSGGSAVVPGPLAPSGLPRVVVEADAVRISQPLVTRTDGRAWGTAVAVAHIRDLVSAGRLDELAETDRYNYRLTYRPPTGDSRVFLSTVSSLQDPVSHDFGLADGGTMTLAFTPKEGWIATRSLTLILAVLGAVCALFGISIYRILRHPELLRRQVEARTNELASANASLEKEMQERAQVEQALKCSHALLDSVFDNIPFMVLVKRTDDLTIVRANRYSEVILGRDRDALIGMSCEQLLPSATAAQLAALDREAVHSRYPAATPEVKMELWGGQAGCLRATSIPLLDHAGEVGYVVQLAEDISERNRLQDALSDQLHFLEQLLDAIPAPIFFKDTEGRYIGCNQAFERLMGRTRNQIIGATVYDIAPKELADVYRNADLALMNNPGTQVYETQVLAAGGVKHDNMFYKATFQDRSGAVGGIVGVYLDITEHKSAERRITQLNRTLTVLTEINEAVFCIRDRRGLLERACEVLIEKGGFPLSFVYFVGEPGEEPTLFTAKGGNDEFAAFAIRTLAQHQDACRLPGLSGEKAAGLIRNAMDCCESGLTATAPRHGFHSLAVLPLQCEGRCIGGMGIFGAEPDMFGDEETRLLRELADDLSYALEAIALEEARKAAEKDLRLAAQVFENSHEGIMITDAENRILMVNKAFSIVTGYQPQDVVGKNPRILSSGQQDPAFYRQMWESLQQNGEWHGEVKNRRKNGEFYPEWLTISLVKNDKGETTNHVAVFTDITTRKRIEERLNFLAHYDVLTELPNRVLFVDRLEQSIRNAPDSAKKRIGVMFIDLDRFNLINETFGHSAGDLLLLEVSRRLSACLREVDSASRLGGDEFAIVLPEVESVEEVSAIAQRMLDSLASIFRFGEREAYISASIGISLFPEDGHDAQSLAKNAEAAMYKAMDEGGNKYRFYQQEMNARSSERISMETSLRHALERGELFLHYQPLVEAATGRIIGAEALLRWMRPDRGLVPPAAFVPLLEETQLISRVGEWILATVCEHNSEWRRATGSDLMVSINFSAVQLAEPDIVESIATKIRELNFDSRFLEIELTESVIMRDTERAINVLYGLKELGLKLSIDDFGTGYSSLSYLRRFPFDTLKIDRSFVYDMNESEAAAIVRAIIALGHSLDLNIIAEGVETPEQAVYLRRVGCDILQGWRYSPAVSHEHFLDLVRKQPFRHQEVAESSAVGAAGTLPPATTAD